MAEHPVSSAATTEALAGHHEATAFGLDAPFFVALSMLIVIGIMIWKKVPGVIAGALDRKIAGIRAQLDEAKALRAEAEALKAEYEAKSAAAAKEADDILAHAHEEAGTIVAQARADAEALIERRGRMAEDKIAAAERAAVAEVRAKAASLSAAAAARLIGEGHGAEADRRLIDSTIAGLGTSTRLN